MKVVLEFPKWYLRMREQAKKSQGRHAKYVLDINLEKYGAVVEEHERIQSLRE